MTSTSETEARPSKLEVPPLSCDCHMHIFGPLATYPYFAGRIYTPPEASIADYLAMRERLGLERTVVVQPSVYGADNSCQMNAMAVIPGARGVAVIDGSEPDAEVERLHKAGFRGARINLMQGSVDGPIEGALERIGARLRQIGWHLQVFTGPEVLASVEPILLRFPVPVMLDHFANLSAWAGPSQLGIDVILRLLRDGPCSMKLSAAYHHPRHEEAGGSDKARQLVAKLIETVPDRLVWGSNWPHPFVPARNSEDEAPFAPFRKIDDVEMLSFLVDWAGDAATLQRILADNPARFYDF